MQERRLCTTVTSATVGLWSYLEHVFIRLFSVAQVDFLSQFNHTLDIYTPARQQRKIPPHFKMSTSVKFAQLELAPKAEPELGSVVFKVSASSNPGERIDDNAIPDHESTPEETIPNSSPHSLLVDDPFSTRNSKILFESIGAYPFPCTRIRCSL